MVRRLTFQYDREADILYINLVPPYAAQESEELGDDIIARLNPKTGKIENLNTFLHQPIVETRMVFFARRRRPGAGSILRKGIEYKTIALGNVQMEAKP